MTTDIDSSVKGNDNRFDRFFGRDAVEEELRQRAFFKLRAQIELLGLAARSAMLFSDRDEASNSFSSGLDSILEEIRSELSGLCGFLDD